MAKWADYLISGVRYNAKRTHIEMVKVHQDLGDTVGVAIDTPRETIVANIRGGNSYLTIFKGTDENWKKGQDVRIIKVGSEEFIRTDANAIASDNLENLPEF